jgi:competence protein ComEC
MSRCVLSILFAAAVALAGCLESVARAGQSDGRLDIYYIDVEGGAAQLIVTPGGESVLIDSGYPDNGGRDLNRILNVVRDVAQLHHIDHALVSHWHTDHYGNHAALASRIEVRHFWDRGIPDALQEDPKFPEKIAAYRAATQNQSQVLKAGAEFAFEDKLPLQVRVVSASREVIPNAGEPNPHAALSVPQDADPTDNSASISLLLTFGAFRYLCCGDLTWNVEGELVTPNNPLGQVDLFMVTHHGLPVSNNPALVLAVDPVVAVMCNGPTKGGHADVQATLRKVKSLKDLYQLHRNVNLPADAQAPAEFIANSEPTVNCSGVWVKASVAPDGKSYTVQIGPEGKQREYQCRAAQ